MRTKSLCFLGACILFSSGAFAFTTVQITQLAACTKTVGCNTVYVKFTYTGNNSPPPTLSMALMNNPGTYGWPAKIITPYYDGAYHSYPLKTPPNSCFAIGGTYSIKMTLSNPGSATATWTPPFSLFNNTPGIMCVPVSIGDNGSGGYNYTFGSPTYGPALGSCS